MKYIHTYIVDSLRGSARRGNSGWGQRTDRSVGNLINALPLTGSSKAARQLLSSSVMRQFDRLIDF